MSMDVSDAKHGKGQTPVMKKIIALSMILLMIMLAISGCHDDGSDRSTIVGEPASTPTPAPTPTPLVVKEMIIVAIGDSITYGIGGSNDEGYPPRLEYRLRNAGENVRVINVGIPGEKSPETNARFSGEIQGADMVLLMIGTNDIRFSGMCDGDPCSTEKQIASMLEQALRAGVAPIVSTIIPFLKYEKDDDVRALNQRIKAVASQKGVSVIDNYHALSSAGFSVYDDRYHPNDQGYEIMAEEWYKTISRKL